MRAFMQAGAASVVATLWPVADAETAGLMETFFVELEGGAAPAAALTRARRQAIADPRTAHPFYWAGFVIGGGR
jgi:CHAT domain-containing protein